jgi:hypothetical protein
MRWLREQDNRRQRDRLTRFEFEGQIPKHSPQASAMQPPQQIEGGVPTSAQISRMRIDAGTLVTPG